MPREAIDLPSFDRDVRRAAGRLDQLRGWLATGTAEARERARSFDPFDGVRHMATKSTYESLQELEPSILDVPLKEGLLRWVHELLQARIGLDLVLADADAMHALDTTLHPTHVAEAKRVAAARASGVAADAEQSAETHTYADAFAALVRAPDPSRAARALDRAAALAAPVGAVRKERRERRFEASRRLGLAHPFALATTLDVGGVAHALLDATEPLARELLAASRKKAELSWRASSAIEVGLARDARDGWPSRLTQRWLDEAFKALAPRGVDAGRLPEALGASSFLRAAEAWGFAWRTSSAPRSMPFALARDPYPTPAFRFGFALASVVGEPSFQKHVLELPSRLANAQVRTLRAAMFQDARVIAARAICASEESISSSLFEELGMRLFGAPLPESMRDAWPDPRTTDASRLVALLGTPSFLAQTVARFDDDWFRNPRAGKHLTSLACGPAFDVDLPPDGAAVAMARAFEGALG
jgi:hypothetical protein